MQPPTLSALEEQTAKVNTRAAFDRLFWAAGGKRRLKKATRKTRHYVQALIVSSVGLSNSSAFNNEVVETTEQQAFKLLAQIIVSYMKKGDIPKHIYPAVAEGLFKVIRLFRSSKINTFLFNSIMRRRAAFTLTALLKHLEAAAYRAHLAKRVKPVTRRTSAPRPLYARPRPPTAPTAPPLLEA